MIWSSTCNKIKLAKHYAFLSYTAVISVVTQRSSPKSSYKFLILKNTVFWFFFFSGRKLSGPKNFTPYDFCLYTCMQPHKRRERAFSLKVNFRCFFFYFQLPYWCTFNTGTSMYGVYMLKHHKVAWNVLANNSEMVHHTDLRLEELVYVT